MKRRMMWTLLGVTAGLILTVVPTRASDIVGIYCVVTNVVMSPNEKAPTTAQVWGACATATGGVMEDGKFVPGWYAAPRKGYLYYSAPQGKEDICLREWSDLKKVAGTGEVVGFASRGQNIGRIRLAAETPRDPDVYPIHNGVQKLNIAQAVARNSYSGDSAYQSLVLALKQAAGTK
jgi:hypothetical protein